MKKAIRVAYWSYEGSSPNGKDHPRHGDMKLAQIAHAWIDQNFKPRELQTPTDLVIPIPPSAARCKPEKSSFGRVYAFRITDPDLLMAWYRNFAEGE